MSNLKKSLIAIILLTFVSVTSAQTFGLRAGFNLSTIDSKSNQGSDGNYGYSYNLKLNPGFHFGATAEFPLAKLFSLETGLLLTTKGYKNSGTVTFYDGTTADIKQNFKLYYIELPVNVKATFDLIKTKPYVFLGPYIGFGIVGKSKEETTQNGQTSNFTTDNIWGAGGYPRIEFGLNTGAGIAINSYQFGIFYSFGLTNCLTNPGTGNAAKNRVIALTVGYELFKKWKTCI